MSLEKIVGLVFKFLVHRRVRSLLTTVGIAIGVALVFSIISVNEGMMALVSQQLEDLGGNVVTIIPKIGGVRTAGSFTEEEVDAVRSLASVKEAAGIYSTVLPVTIRGKTDYMGVYGYDSHAIEEVISGIKSFRVEKGRFISAGERKKVVLGYKIANDNNLGPGSVIKIDDVDFRVVGVLAEIGSSEDDSSINTDVEDLWELTGEDKTYQFILAKVVEPDEDRIRRAIKKVRGRDDFDVMTPESMMEQVNQILGLLNAVFLVIAGVSIAVGSVGVVNTMYMSVFERVREIGIMKAVGATDWNIMLIFLLESGLLSLVGGVFGMLLGFSLAVGITKLAAMAAGLTKLKPVFSSGLVVLSLGLSFVVGVLAGIFPARYASGLEPVDALRYE